MIPNEIRLCLVNGHPKAANRIYELSKTFSMSVSCMIPLETIKNVQRTKNWGKDLEVN